MFHWTTEDIPSQSGRRVVTTGATGGLGYETALALAAAGAEVVLTGRNAVKGKTALESIRAQYPTVSIRYQRLDLASLRSVAHGALPTLFAATAPDAKGGAYYGPKGFFELKGPVAEAFVARQAMDETVAARLWNVSEQLTGVRWPTAAQGHVS